MSGLPISGMTNFIFVSRFDTYFDIFNEPRPGISMAGKLNLSKKFDESSHQVFLLASVL